MKTIVLFTMLSLCYGCTIFEKNMPSNELQDLSEEVLKKHEGIDIEIKPVDVEKK